MELTAWTGEVFTLDAQARHNCHTWLPPYITFSPSRSWKQDSANFRSCASAAETSGDWFTAQPVKTNAAVKTSANLLIDLIILPNYWLTPPVLQFYPNGLARKYTPVTFSYFLCTRTSLKYGQRSISADFVNFKVTNAQKLGGRKCTSTPRGPRIWVS